MKMVKSLLLGSAAGLLAVSGAQAADLPVKAKAVEYVKICSLYGVGYYYIPGTDTCIKIGGYVRTEAYHNGTGYAYVDRNSVGRFTNNGADFGMQARFRLTTDVRTQTEYGTLRSYFSMGLNWLNAPDDYALPSGVGNFAFAMERAFIQFAGFTVGRADTMFGFFNSAAYGLVPMFLDGSSGPSGHNIFAYTWQFGNGLSATLSAEDAWGGRQKAIVDFNAGTLGGSVPAADNAGQRIPDIVANLRVDQAWGSAQIMGALHEVRGRYYNANTNGLFPGCTGVNLGTTNCEASESEWGWAAGAGLTLKMPWDAKDTLSGVIAYAKGAGGFVAYSTPNQVFTHRGGGVAVGPLADAAYRVNPDGTPSGLELTTTWGGAVAFEHYWTPSLRTSWVFGYLDVEYSDTVKSWQAAAGGNLCNGGAGPKVTTNCNPDYSLWRLASRTMWNPVANLDVGVEVAYTQINTAFAGSSLVNAGNNLAVGVYNIEDQAYWSATLRVQRNFWP